MDASHEPIVNDEPTVRRLRIPAAALADALRVARPSLLSRALAAAYPVLAPRQRARLLGHLLTALGPLALAVLGAGRFASHMFRERWDEVAVTVDEVAGLTAAQFAEIVSYVEQSDPGALLRGASLMTTDSGSLLALGAAALALALRAASAQRVPPGG